MAFTMACPNFKNGLKMVSGPLGVNNSLISKFETSNKEQSMSSTIFLSHASNFKGDKRKMEHSTWIYFNTMQNSSRRHKGWHCTNPLQLLLWE
jgi:hypothetical protein